MSFQNKKKILIVAESIDVEDSSGTKGRVALIQNLHNIGYELKVLHYTRKEVRISGVDCVAIKENRRSFLFFLSRLERQLRLGLKMDLHKPLEKIFGFSFTLFNDRNSIVAALQKMKDFEPDLILTLSRGGSFRPHHALLQIPEYHSRWLAYIHDPYPMHLYPRPYVWVEPGYYKKWFFMKQISLKAAYSAFPSKLLMEWMGSYFLGFLERGTVIPHQIGAASRAEIRSFPNFFDPEKFNLLHGGNLLHARDPQGLVKAFELFLIRNPEAKNQVQLSFIGNSSFHTTFLLEKEKDIPQLFFKGESIPFDHMNFLQGEASVNIILEAKSEISPFLPGKFPHCVAADKPVLLLGPYYSESRRLLGADYRFWAEIHEVEKICDHLEYLYHSWVDKSDLKLNRPDLLNYLSENHLKKTIEQLSMARE